MEKIPERFGSAEHYLSSFVYPLLEETRAELCSRLDSISTLPYARVTGFKKIKPYEKNWYKFTVDRWRIDSTKQNKEPYNVLPNDLLILAKIKPGTVSDLHRMGGKWRFATVTKIFDQETGQDLSSACFTVATVNMGDVNLKEQQLIAIFVGNMTTNGRIWTALHMRSNLSIVKEILCTDSLVRISCLVFSEFQGGAYFLQKSLIDFSLQALVQGRTGSPCSDLSFVDLQGEEECSVCPSQSDFCNENLGRCVLTDLDKCQAKTVITCLRKICCKHRPVVELVWGPPGTGKTKTTSMMLLNLLRVKCRTVVCAPTNVAVVEVASRVVQLMRGPDSLRQVLLFGNKGLLKVDDSDVEEIYLEYRVQSIIEFHALLRRCKQLISPAINVLDDAVYRFHSTPTNESGEKKSFLKFVEEIVKTSMEPLKGCLSTLCTHKSADYILKDHDVHKIRRFLSKLGSFSARLSRKNLSLFSEESEEAIIVHLKRSECFPALKLVQDFLYQLKLPSSTSKREIQKLCFQSATLIFCTASNTIKLHSVDMEPPKLLIIDEAAQLKECESVIPLQLPGLKHTILIGDERQLPSLVNSDVSNAA